MSLDVTLAQRIVDLLNEMLELDPKATLELFRHHTPCNQALAEHSTVQVGAPDASAPFAFEVGLLGVLNGLTGTTADHLGIISCECEGEDWASLAKINRFVILEERLEGQKS